MLHRVLSTAALAVLLGAGQALAGDPPVLPCPPGAEASAETGEEGARWPAALKKRNARYAALTRVDDPEGDLHERLIAHMDLVRVHDRIGDLEELRRKRAAGHVPPQVVVHARTTRDQDLDGDEGEVILAATTNERRYAETRRFRDLGGDREELVAYRRDVRSGRAGPVDDERIMHARDRERAAVRDFFDNRADHAREGLADPTLSDEEREQERRGERQDELNLIREEGNAERESERDHERAQEREDEQAATLAETELERAAEMSAEQLEERQLDAQLDRQLEQEESGTGGGGSLP